MKLDKSGTTKYLWDTLTKLLKAEIFRNYYLVGGTAYSLQIGHRISDDIDLFTPDKLDKEMPINKIFENFQKKYGMDNFWHYQKSVVYFDDVEDSSWNGLKFLKENVSKDTIKNTLTQAVIEYERSILLP